MVCLTSVLALVSTENVVLVFDGKDGIGLLQAGVCGAVLLIGILGPFIPRLFWAPGWSPRRPMATGGISLLDWLAARLSPACGVEVDVAAITSSPSELLRSIRFLPVVSGVSVFLELLAMSK